MQGVAMRDLTRGSVIKIAILGLMTALIVVSPNSQAPASGQDAVTAHFVVDTSGSMGGSPLQEAKGALETGIRSLPDTHAAGLREFSGSCASGGNLLVNIGLDNRPELYAAVDGLTASGGTPSPQALRAAAADLPDSGERSIVFISDGASTCGDPCPVAAEISQELGVSFRVHTVGFRAPESAEGELACIADATGGVYVSAGNEEELANAIRGVIDVPQTCPPVQVIAARGSGQSFEDASTLVDPLQSFVNSLRANLVNEDAETWDTEDALEIVALEYDAVSASKAAEAFFSLARDGLVPGRELDPTAGNEYLDSVTQGRERLSDAVEAVSNCTDTKVVLTGFSQGAHVTGDVLDWPVITRSDQVVAVRLFGDPRFNPDDPAAVPGNSRNGGILGARGTTLGLGPTVVESWCIPGDPICDSGFLSAARSKIEGSFKDGSRHSSYHTASVQQRVPTSAAAASTCRAILGEPCTTLRFGDGLGPGFDDPSRFRGQVPWQTRPGRLQ